MKAKKAECKQGSQHFERVRRTKEKESQKGEGDSDQGGLRRPMDEWVLRCLHNSLKWGSGTKYPHIGYFALLHLRQNRLLLPGRAFMRASDRQSQARALILVPAQGPSPLRRYLVWAKLT